MRRGEAVAGIFSRGRNGRRGHGGAGRVGRLGRGERGRVARCADGRADAGGDGFGGAGFGFGPGLGFGLWLGLVPGFVVRVIGVWPGEGVDEGDEDVAEFGCEFGGEVEIVAVEEGEQGDAGGWDLPGWMVGGDDEDDDLKEDDGEHRGRARFIGCGVAGAVSQTIQGVQPRDGVRVGHGGDIGRMPSGVKNRKRTCLAY